MAVQTVLLVAVSVFRYTVGSYYAALLLNALFWSCISHVAVLQAL